METGRKISGGKYHSRRKTRLHERTSQERKVILGTVKRKTLRHRGGHEKKHLLTSNIANVFTSKGAQQTAILNVKETPQNKFLARENRLMKGAIIETDLGKAKITNRPSREGMINAILIE